MWFGAVRIHLYSGSPEISHRSNKQECKHFGIQGCFHHICIYTAWERMDGRFTRERERNTEYVCVKERESTYPEANPFYSCVFVCVCNRSFFKLWAPIQIVLPMCVSTMVSDYQQLLPLSLPLPSLSLSHIHVVNMQRWNTPFVIFTALHNLPVKVR